MFECVYRGCVSRPDSADTGSGFNKTHTVSRCLIANAVSRSEMADTVCRALTADVVSHYNVATGRRFNDAFSVSRSGMARTVSCSQINTVSHSGWG
jgi:hypothetical protein